MKPSEFRLFLSAVAAVAGPDDAHNLLQLVPLFEVKEFKSVAELAKGLQPNTDAGPQSTHLALAKTLRKLERLFREFGKPAVAKDIGIVTELVAASHDPNVGTFVENALERLRRRNSPKQPKQQVRADTIRYWGSLLEQSLGDDAAFSRALIEMQNADVRTREWVVLAKEFASASVKGKAAALKRIKARHEAMLAAHAKAAATAGRVAG